MAETLNAANSVATPYNAPSSLEDHCRQMGEERDPTNFGSSVPGGIWSSPMRKKTPEHSRNSSAECLEKEDHGVPIYRVDHKIGETGFIFTPKDDAPIPQRSYPVTAYPTAVPEAGEVPPCSQSLADFCKALGEKHDPTQFGTSVPGGCWGASSPGERPLTDGPDGKGGDSKEAPGVPIFRAEHKMDADGFLFTPRKSSRIAMVVGSLESDSDASWRASPMQHLPMHASTSPAPKALDLFGGPPPNLTRGGARLTPPMLGAGTLGEILPSVGEGRVYRRDESFVEEAAEKAKEAEKATTNAQGGGDFDPLDAAFERTAAAQGASPSAFADGDSPAGHITSPEPEWSEEEMLEAQPQQPAAKVSPKSSPSLSPGAAQERRKKYGLDRPDTCETVPCVIA